MTTTLATDDRAALLKGAQSALQSGDFVGGARLADKVLAGDAEDGEALYIAAVARRYLKDFPAASALLERLHAAMPEYGRAWQEEGHLARAQGDDARALAAFDRATRFNPALVASWKAQAELAGAAGRSALAEASAAQARRIEALPPELVAVTNHLHEGRLLRAEEICRHYQLRHPRNVEGMRLLAAIAAKFGVLDDAEFLLETAIELDPENVQLRLDAIQVLRQRQKYAEAREQAEWLHRRNPADPLFQSHLAIESMQTGDFDQAFELFEQVLEKLPNDPATLTSRGHALKTRGRHDDAVASYRAAFAAKPDHGDAYYALANLKTYRFSESEIAEMERQAARADLAFMDRVHFAFALGKAHEDAGNYEASFRNYEQGNTLKRRQTRYDADRMGEELERQREFCTPELFAKHAGAGHPSSDPIFIVGLPRAGSTLLEQILASHSQVDGTMELPNILSLAHRLRGNRPSDPAYPSNLHDLTDEQLKKMGADFIASTRVHRGDAPFFIDKMPNNFRHIGLIKLILPNAKIIDARRAPMDCCFSGYKQLFAEGQEFTYGLEEVGRYYADYVRLMDHWDRVLPGEVLKVQHEDVLDDLEGQVRQLLDFCGLPFEQACIDFHKTDRAVRTASSEQVRQPINRKGQDAWKPYKAWLGELKAALGPHAPEDYE